MGRAGTKDGQFDAPGGIAIDAAGRAYAADWYNYRIQVFDADGALLETWGSKGSGEGQLDAIVDLAVDAAGTIHVSDQNGRVQHFDGEGAYLSEIGAGPGQFTAPTGIGVDGGGNVYVVDQTRDQVDVFGPDGAWLTSWGGPGDGPGQVAAPSYLALDAVGNLYLADKGNDRVQKFRLLPPLAP